MRTALLVLILAASPMCTGAAAADCIRDAAAYQGVHHDVLRAIGWHESRLRPDAIARNRNGSTDIGAFQINSMHLGRLARFGIDAQALRDGCVSAYVAAWHYRQQVDRYGHGWRAVGHYHSHTPARSAWYANAIARILMHWRVIPTGPLPYAPSQTLAPTTSSGSAPAADTADIMVLDLSEPAASSDPVSASPPAETSPP